MAKTYTVYSDWKSCCENKDKIGGPFSYEELITYARSHQIPRCAALEVSGIFGGYQLATNYNALFPYLVDAKAPKIADDSNKPLTCPPLLEGRSPQPSFTPQSPKRSTESIELRGSGVATIFYVFGGVSLIVLLIVLLSLSDRASQAQSTTLITIFLGSAISCFISGAIVQILADIRDYLKHIAENTKAKE